MAIVTGEKQPMVVNVDKKKKSFEEKEYLICIECMSGDLFWEVVKGRTEAYSRIKYTIYVDAVNFDTSFILVEGKSITERVSLYAFLKHVQDYFEDGFDIDDYVKGDFDEEEFRKNNNISEAMSISNDERLDMKDIMNNNIDYGEAEEE